jgi:type IV secretory pathway component VirB8
VAIMQKNNWTTDIYSHAITWRNWSICIAIISLFISAISVMSLLTVFPLKENTPFLVYIDQDKGYPVTIKPVASNELIENDDLKKYMIRKFIIARERFNPLTIDDDTNIVYTLSSENVFNDYQNHLSKYKDNDNNINVDSINISFLNPHRAYVSFTLLLNQHGVTREIPANAQIKFHFTDKFLPMDEAYLINPVNFEVETYQSHYQVNHEVYL